MDSRKKLETEVERQIHALVAEVKEHVVDFTVLTVRKRHPDIDREQMSRILDIVRQGIDDGFMTKIDRFMGKLDNSLTEFSGAENPLEQEGSTPPASATKRATRSRNTSSV